MTEHHHPTWSEVRETFLADPEVQAAAEELHQILQVDQQATLPVVITPPTERTMAIPRRRRR